MISPPGEVLGLGRIRGVGLTRGGGLAVWAVPEIAVIANVKVAKTIVIVFVDLIGTPFLG